jgi:hypothetical protein
MHKQENIMHDQEAQYIPSSAACNRSLNFFGNNLERSYYQNTTTQQTNEESDFERGWRSLILRHSHFAHPKRVGRSPLISRAAHDQYATVPKKYHVIQNVVLSQNA